MVDTSHKPAMIAMTPTLLPIIQQHLHPGLLCGVMSGQPIAKCMGKSGVTAPVCEPFHKLCDPDTGVHIQNFEIILEQS